MLRVPIASRSVRSSRPAPSQRASYQAHSRLSSSRISRPAQLRSQKAAILSQKPSQFNARSSYSGTTRANRASTVPQAQTHIKSSHFPTSSVTFAPSGLSVLHQNKPATALPRRNIKLTQALSSASPSLLFSSSSTARVPTFAHQKNTYSTEHDDWKPANWKELSIWQKTKIYFWMSMYAFRDLYRNTKRANQLSKDMKAGEHLSRRDYRFYKQNRSDLVKIIPFVIMYKIPLLGKLFTIFAVLKAPHLLPSTFTFLIPRIKFRDQLMRTEKLRAAAFKMDTYLPWKKLPPALAESANKLPMTQEMITERLKELHYEDVKPRKLYYTQLVNILAAVHRTRFGWPKLLARRFKTHMREIIKDDEMLTEEGIEDLTLDELEEANLERGLRLAHLRVPELKTQLQEWLKLEPEEKRKLIISHYGFARPNQPVLWLSDAYPHPRNIPATST